MEGQNDTMNQLDLTVIEHYIQHLRNTQSFWVYTVYHHDRYSGHKISLNKFKEWNHTGCVPLHRKIKLENKISKKVSNK